MLTRAGARCLLGGGRSLSALCVLGWSTACAVDSLDRLGAGNVIGRPDAGAEAPLDGPLRPDSLTLDAGAQTGLGTSEPGSHSLVDAGNGDVPSASAELMPNPGFEEGHEGWSGLGTSSIVDVLEAHGGSRALLSTNRTAAWDGPAYDLRALVDPGQPYAVSLWVRNELDTQMIMLTLKAVCDGQTSYTSLATRIVATRWLQLTSGFFAPECSTALQELVVYVQGPPAFKNVLLDDVSLRAVTLSGGAQEITDAGASAGPGSASGGPSPSTTTTTSGSSTGSACVGNTSGNASSNPTANSNASCNGNTSQ